MKDEEMARNVAIIPEDAYQALHCVKPSAMREVFVEVPNVGIFKIL
jgi:SpoVK/Ycf46/Vps4 family AAA+-type ATPase